ncbi:hypothetical protein ACAG39_08315 [Caldicellulosiruptoraceae bacterium PP1]
MKKLLIIPFILVFLLSGCSTVDIFYKSQKVYKKDDQKKIKLLPKQLVRIDADNSNIIIKQNNNDELSLEYTKKILSKNEIKSQLLNEYFNEMIVDLGNQNNDNKNEVVIKSRAYLSEAITNNNASDIKRSIDLTISIPQKSNLSIQNGNGNIFVKTLYGSLYIVNGNGNIQINEINGSLDIRNGSGNVNIDFVKGNVSINNGNGNIESDISQAQTISIINNNGNITSRIDKLKSYKRSIIQGGNGNIKLSFTKEVSSKVLIKTSSKSIKSDFELKKLNDTYTTSIYGDNHQIDIVLGNGDIEIERE